MIGNLVEKTLKEAFFNFAEKENVEKHEIAFFIQSPSKEHMPVYTYAVRNELKMTAEGEIHLIDFTKDILLIKRVDFLGREGLLAKNLTIFWQAVEAELDKDSTGLQIRVDFNPNSNKLMYHLIQGTELIKELALDDIIMG